MPEEGKETIEEAADRAAKRIEEPPGDDGMDAVLLRALDGGALVGALWRNAADQEAGAEPGKTKDAKGKEQGVTGNENDNGKKASLPAKGLQALLDLAEGYVSENGAEAGRRYADPAELEKAMRNAATALKR